MEKLLNGAIVADGEGRFFASEAYARFHAFTGEAPRGDPPSDGEWGELGSFFSKEFPEFYQFVAINHRLTRDQLRLCQLMRLSFPHYVMARVMGVDSKRITRLKAQVNRRLFSDGHASTLECNLRLHF
jgi:hypothetical protein